MSAEDPDIKDRKGTQPKKYHTGLAKSTKTKRDAHFKKGADMNDDNPDAYKPAPGDADAKTKTSKHTKKFKDMYGEEKAKVVIEDASKALKNKSEKSGMPVGILRKVYARGVAAWRTGHRPGTTPQQWGLARVNSFVTKSSGTWGKADADLAGKVRNEEVKENSRDEYTEKEMERFYQFNEAKTAKSHPWYVHSASSFKSNSKMGRFESEEEAKAYVKRTQKHMPKNKLEIGKGKYPIIKEGLDLEKEYGKVFYLSAKQIAAQKDIVNKLKAKWEAVEKSLGYDKGKNKDSMGMTPEAIRTNPKWRSAKTAWTVAYEKEKKMNQKMLKVFGKELKDLRQKDRNAYRSLYMVEESTEDSPSKSFTTFTEYIEEAFNTPYKYSGGKRDNDLYSYKFDTLDLKTGNKSRVDVIITGSESPDDEDEYMWELSFSRQQYGSDKTRYDVTGEGDAIRIFATVIAISNDFIKKENPKFVVFGAEKSKDSGGSKQLQSREKLYLRMAKKYFGGKYKIRINAGSRESLFFLDRKK